MADSSNDIFNSNTDDMVAKWEKAYGAVEVIMKRSNEEIIRGMEQTVKTLGSLYERFVDKYKLESENLLRITEQVYKTLQDFEERYTKEKLENLSEQINEFKKAMETEVSANREALQQKTEMAEREIAQEKSRSEERKQIIKNEVEEAKKQYEGLISSKTAAGIGSAARTGASTVQTAMGSDSGRFGDFLSMGADVVGGTALLMSVNYGEGVRQLSNVVAKLIGMYVKLSIEEVARNREMLSVSAAGVEGPRAGMEGEVQSLRHLGTTFAGMEEFQPNRVMGILKNLSSTREFSEVLTPEKQTEFYRDNALLGMSQGVGPEETFHIYAELREKLHAPVEDLAGIFSQLSIVSKDLERPLKEVANDFLSLHRDVQAYGFTREQELNMLAKFNQELKVGILSVSDLSEYMKGLSGQTQEGATGVAALLQSTDLRQGVMKRFIKGGGKEEEAETLFNIMDQLDPVTGGAALRVMNNPEAKGPVVDALRKQLTQVSGMGKSELEDLNPAIEKLLYALTEEFADVQGHGNLGNQQLLYEKFGSLVGLNMDANLTKQGKNRRGILGVGEDDKIEDFGTSLDKVTKQTETYHSLLMDEGMSKMQLFIKSFDQLTEDSKLAMEQYIKSIAEGKSHTEALNDASGKLSKAFDNFQEHIQEGLLGRKLPKTSEKTGNLQMGEQHWLSEMLGLDQGSWWDKALFGNSYKYEQVSNKEGEAKKEFTLTIEADEAIKVFSQEQVQQMVTGGKLDESVLQIFKDMLSSSR